MRPYSEDVGYRLAEELKNNGYLRVKDGEKDLLTVIVSGDKDKIGTDTIQVRYI